MSLAASPSSSGCVALLGRLNLWGCLAPDPAEATGVSEEAGVADRCSRCGIDALRGHRRRAEGGTRHPVTPSDAVAHPHAFQVGDAGTEAADLSVIVLNRIAGTTDAPVRVARFLDGGKSPPLTTQNLEQ